MDAGQWVSWADCPNCGGLVALCWLGRNPIAVDCVRGCLLRVDQVQVSASSRIRAGLLGGDVEQMAAILEDAVLETTEAYGLTDPRVAAALVADAWRDILGEEGRSLRLAALATTAVREVGARLHRRQISVGRENVRDASTDVRVLIVGDHPFARLRLMEMLAGEAGVSVVGECEDSQAVDAAARLRPHVVCVDRYMAITDGHVQIRALRAADPEVRIVLLTGGSGARLDMAVAGTNALVPTETNRDALLRCLRTVARRGADCPYCL